MSKVLEYLGILSEQAGPCCVELMCVPRFLGWHQQVGSFTALQQSTKEGVDLDLEGLKSAFLKIHFIFDKKYIGNLFTDLTKVLHFKLPHT